MFETNHTIKSTEVRIQINPGCYPVPQKARPIPFQLQQDVRIEQIQLIKSGNLKRLETIEEDYFVSLVVVTVKKDKTGKITLDARKIDESCVKKRPHIYGRTIKSNISELSRNDDDLIWISEIDLDYAYGQIKVAPQTSKHCNFALTGENMNGYYQFLKCFHGPADIPTFFQEKKRQFFQSVSISVFGFRLLAKSNSEFSKLSFSVVFKYVSSRTKNS